MNTSWSSLRAAFARALLPACGVAWLAGAAACRNPQPAPAAAAVWPAGWLPSQAQVIEVRGGGSSARSPGGASRKLKAGDWLPEGTSIQVPPFSMLRLRFYDLGIVVEVKPDSVLTLESLSYRKEGALLSTRTVLDLRQGSVAVDGGTVPPGSDLEIRTPQGVSRFPPGR